MSTLTQQLKDTTDLDEKLRLIDEMLKLAKPQVVNGKVVAPVDPFDSLVCQGGCQ